MAAHLKIFLLIGAISTAVYANSLHNSFHFDDQHYVVENPYIRDLSNIPSFFISSKYSSFEKAFTGHYRPLLVTSYAINYVVGGLNPMGYHVVNLLFHIGSAFIVFLIFQAMVAIIPTPETPELVSGSGQAISLPPLTHPSPPGGEGQSLPRTCFGGEGQAGEGDRGGKKGRGVFFIALTASLIFAVHPFNSEVVNYITARSSVMCSFFYLLAFYYWVRYRGQENSPHPSLPQRPIALAFGRNGYPGGGLAHFSLPPCGGGLGWGWYIASILAFILAMLTKEIAITLPVMLFVYDLYFLRSCNRHPYTLGSRETTRRRYLAYIPYILLIVIPYLAYRMLFFGKIAGGGTRDFYTNLLTQSKVLLRYIQLIFLPFGLTIEHDIAISSKIYDLSLIISIISLIVILTAAYLLFKRGGEWRVLSFVILWFFITLLPTTLIPLNAILQENRGYLAGIGFSLLAGVCMGKLRQRVSIPLLLILISFYSILTIQRNSAWKDDYTLWADAVEKAPSSARAHDNLGLAYINRKEYDLAIAEFRKTLKIHPNYYLAYYNAGVVYQLQNRLDMSRSSYEECVRINPQYFRTYYNLGIVYRKIGDMDKAIAAYEKAISLDPRHPFVYNNLGVILTDKGELKRAESVFKRAIEIDPGYVKVHYNLGNLYYRMKKYDLAVEAYRSALKIKPDYSEAKKMLDAALMKLSQNQV